MEWNIILSTFCQRLQINFIKTLKNLFHLSSVLHTKRCLQYRMCIRACKLSLQSYPTLCHPVNYNPPGSSVYGDSPGKNAGVGCHFFLQGIFLTHRSKHRVNYKVL